MIEYTITDAVYANAEKDALVAFTKEAGAVLVTKENDPVFFAEIEVFHPIRAYVEPEVPIAPISAAQAKLALDDVGLLDAVIAAVAAHPVRAVGIWYNNANIWERGNPYIQALGIELGLTDDQIDDLFKAASLK